MLDRISKSSFLLLVNVRVSCDTCPIYTMVDGPLVPIITDGPLVPIIQLLVPIENDVIPMVLLVNMHLIKGT